VVPALVLPVALLVVVLLWPFLEAWVTGDKEEHHLLQRPRDAPTRTAFFVALMTCYGLLWAAGGNDVLAIRFGLSVNQITYVMRAAVFLLPVVAFVVTKRWCISLQRQDRDQLLHGRETGVVTRSPVGGYREQHRPLSHAAAHTLTAAGRDEPLQEEGMGRTEGVGRPRLSRLRHRLSRAMFADNLTQPTAGELERAGHLRHGDRSVTSGSASSPGSPADPSQ